MKLLGSLSKPKIGLPCNGCGYCCTVEPCSLASEFLHCEKGPCVALETRDGKFSCGLVRNPLGYLFKAAHPDVDVQVLDAAPQIEEAVRLSRNIAEALGVGRGCDSLDDEHSEAWPMLIATTNFD